MPVGGQDALGVGGSDGNEEKKEGEQSGRCLDTKTEPRITVQAESSRAPPTTAAAGSVSL